MSRGTTHQGDGGRLENPPETFASVHSQIDRMFTELQRIETHFKKEVGSISACLQVAGPKNGVAVWVLCKRPKRNGRNHDGNRPPRRILNLTRRVSWRFPA